MGWLETNSAEGPPFFNNHSSDRERCTAGKAIRVAFARCMGVSKALKKIVWGSVEWKDLKSKPFCVSSD